MTKRLALPPADGDVTSDVNDVENSAGDVMLLNEPVSAEGEATGSLSAASLEEQRKLAKKRAAERAASRTSAKRQQVSERIASAVEELTSGVADANAAARHLNDVMKQVAAGAGEANSACQEGQVSARKLADAAENNRSNSQRGLALANNLQQLIGTTGSEIESFISTVELAAEKNVESAESVGNLEKQADEIGQVVKAVADIADQTNLLALNAAIEAARAGEHGKGFAVVADEVRNLAEGAEGAARSIRELVADIQRDVEIVTRDTEQAVTAAREQVGKGNEITGQLSQISKDITAIHGVFTRVNDLSTDTAAAVEQFQSGNASMTNLADQTAKASRTALTSTAEQIKALGDIEATTEDLSLLADDLRTSTDSEKNAEQLAAAAEQLSATIAEADSASQQITTAIRQIARISDSQSSGAQQSGVAISHIQKQATDIHESAASNRKTLEHLQRLLAENKVAVESMIEGILGTSKSSVKVCENIKMLGRRVRQIDKIVDAITKVAMQTNLLAVNGAVEAARSGEYGKGFAVVATDIRTLASDSEKNAEKIKDLVRTIQDHVQIVWQDIQQVGTTADQAAQRARQSTEKLKRVEADMTTIRQAIVEMEGDSQRAVSAIGEVKSGIERISRAATQASASSQQATASAQQQSKGMQELAQAIEQIAALADDLQNW